MMPLKQGKILPPRAGQAKNPELFSLLDSAGAAAVSYEPFLTGGMVVQGRARRGESSKLCHVGIRGQESYLVFPFMRLVAESCNRKNRGGACCQNFITTR